MGRFYAAMRGIRQQRSSPPRSPLRNARFAGWMHRRTERNRYFFFETRNRYIRALRRDLVCARPDRFARRRDLVWPHRNDHCASCGQQLRVPPGCLSAPAINASLVYLQFDPSITRWFIVCQVLSWCKYFIDRRADRFTRRKLETLALAFSRRGAGGLGCVARRQRDVPRTTITVALQCRRSKRHLEDVYRMSIF